VLSKKTGSQGGHVQEKRSSRERRRNWGNWGSVTDGAGYSEMAKIQSLSTYNVAPRTTTGGRVFWKKTTKGITLKTHQKKKGLATKISEGA